MKCSTFVKICACLLIMKIMYPKNPNKMFAPHELVAVFLVSGPLHDIVVFSMLKPENPMKLWFGRRALDTIANRQAFMQSVKKARLADWQAKHRLVKTARLCGNERE